MLQLRESWQAPAHMSVLLLLQLVLSMLLPPGSSQRSGPRSCRLHSLLCAQVTGLLLRWRLSQAALARGRLACMAHFTTSNTPAMFIKLKVRSIQWCAVQQQQRSRSLPSAVQSHYAPSFSLFNHHCSHVLETQRQG
jgi:hypothetical protein